MYYDLRIPHDHSKQIVERATELDYDGYALDQVVEAKNLKTLKPLASKTANVITNDSEAIDAHDSAPKRYSRITVVLENNSNLQLSQLDYDIIAVQPTSEKAFIACCSNSDIDLISLEFDSRLPFYIKSSSVSLAISKGIYFEISYAAAISDLNARKSLAINSKNLIRATKGKNIIISSNAQNAMQLRSPNDLMNLYSLFGLNPDKAKAALSKTCRSLLLQAGKRSKDVYLLRKFPPNVRMILKVIQIVTHSGTFHADESLAVYMLRSLPKFSQAALIRTRDEAIISQASIVVDVGAVYDPQSLRFDHHQRGFEETFSPHHAVKLSSAGLIYKHFGRELIAARFNLAPLDEKLDILYNKMYDDFILALDGIDNGVSQYPSSAGEPIYRDSTNLSSRVANLNPWWNQSDVNLDERFLKAVELTGTEFTQKLDYLAKAWLPARDIVLDTLKARFEVDPSGKIMLLKEFCPWKEHLHLLEKSHNINADQLPLYVVYEDDRDHSYRVQAVAVSPLSFESRKALPESWRGLRDEKLSQITGVEGSVFVHATGFIGGCKTKDGVLHLAKKALN